MATVTATVVFTDLVGSTDMAARLGPSQAEVIRSTHFGLLRDALARTGGTEVKNLGDGLMAVYPNLGGALDGAVAMQQNIERHNRKASEPLHVRVGLSTGDAVEEDGDYFGEPVVEAARLCALAASGQIVTTDVVRHLARRTTHVFVPIGSLELKGLPEPVEACELHWAPAVTAASVPLPRRLAVAPRTTVVGRGSESEVLLAALKAAVAGEGRRIVLLAGEPGIGKTTVAGEFARQAHGQGATVLYGRCDDDLRVPYQPLVEALGEYVEHAPDTVLSAIGDRHLSELSRLLPQVRARIPALPAPPATDPDAERYLLFGSVTAALTEMAAAAPLALVLDDLHWADKPTVSLLRHLVVSLDRAEVVVVGTYRDSELDALHPLTEALAMWRREAGVQRLALAGLDDSSVVALLETLAGHELAGDGIELARAVRRETDGNPFFVAEVLRHLAETGAIREEDGRWVANRDLSSIGLPASVRDVVDQRVRRLGDVAARVLTLASVLGRDFDLGLLSRLAELDQDAVLDGLETATSARVVAEVAGRRGWFTFAHALFQHILYEGLSATRRTRLHLRTGALLEAELGDEAGDRIGELARHWAWATDADDVAKAVGYARQAGQRALITLAPDEAIRWFGQAIAHLDAQPAHDAHRRLEILIELGTAQRQAGDPEFRQTLLDAAAEAARLDDPAKLVAAALANQRGFVSRFGQVDVERIAVLEAALSAAGEDDSHDRAMLLATLASELTFSEDRSQARSLADEAEAVARRLGDEPALSRIVSLTFLPLWLPERLERTVAASAEALRIATEQNDPQAGFHAALWRLCAAVGVSDRAGIREAMALNVELAEQIGEPVLVWLALYQGCWERLLSGDAEGAERLALEALQVSADSGQPDGVMVYGINLMNIRMHQGRLEEILPMAAQAAADNSAIPAFQAVYAAFACECGRFDEARPVFEAARAADFHHAVYDYTWIVSTSLWADAAAWLDDQPAARILFDRLAPFETQGITTGASFNGTVGSYLARLAAVLGRVDEANCLFERADAQLRALEAPFWVARNQVEWARLLASTGAPTDRARARDLLAGAQATAATYGCAAVEARARQLAAALD